MRHLRSAASLLLLLLAGVPVAARPAAAGSFNQAWSISGWDYRLNLGNCTGGPEPILLFSSKTDGHYALFDGHTGALVQDFANFQGATFKDTTTVCQSADWTGDGINEIVFNQQGIAIPTFWVFKWNGAAFATLFHPIVDNITGWSLVHARSTSSYDLLTTTPNNIKIRNGATGAALWQASTALPGWLGTTPFSEAQDLDGDGLDDVAVGDYGKSVALIKYVAAAFVTQWSLSGWNLDYIANMDSDAPPEFLMTNATDHHYGIFKSLTGVETGDFPAITQSAGYNMLPIPRDLALGAPVIAVFKTIPSQALSLVAWNGSSFGALYQNLDPTKSVTFPSLRDTTMQEIVEVESNDVLIRDGAGTQLFKASTGIPGWTGVSGTVVVLVNFSGGGVNDLLIYDGGVGGVMRHLHYSGGAFAQVWALSGYYFTADVGNTDNDPAHELVCTNYAGDQSFSLVDSQTGVVKQNWPQFTLANHSLLAGWGDYWRDGKNEIILTRLDGSLFSNSAISATTAFRWNGSSVAPLFTVADSIRNALVCQVRDNLHHELMTVTTSNNIGLRDVFDGTLLLDASAQLAAFTGVDIASAQAYGTLDFAGDGTQDLFVSEPGDVRFIEHTGTASVHYGGRRLAFRVEQNAPNPFRFATTLRFSLPAAGEAEVRIYDAAGRLVRRLDRFGPAGPNAIEWDGRDESGARAPSGVLFYEIRAGALRETRKAVRVE